MTDNNEKSPAILIVEDEPLIRMNAVDLVEDAGFVAIEAANADEALEKLQQHDEICVLFTDIDMPGSMNGLFLANLVHTNWPPIKIIVVSGHLNARETDLPTGGLFFSKPYDINKISSVLQKLVD